MAAESENPSASSGSVTPTSLPTQPPSPEAVAAAFATQPLVVSKMELQGFFSEATKYTVFAVFVLYSIGFLIWNSFLGGYGVSAIGFLQAEFFSAALCYVILVATFSLPPTLLFDPVFGAHVADGPRSSISTIVFLWYAVSSQLIPRFLPGSEFKMPKLTMVLYLMLAVGMLLYVALQVLLAMNWISQWSVKRGWKRSPAEMLNFIRKWDFGTVCLGLFGLVSFLSNKELSACLETQFLIQRRSIKRHRVR